jgi:WD40 repeat protein
MIATSVAYAPNGQYLASGSWDGTVKLWNAHNGEIERTLTGHKYAVNAVAFSPDGKILASAAGWSAMRESPETPGEVILWNAASGERLHTLSDFAHPVSAIAFSPDGQTLATVSYRVDAQSKPASSSKYAAKTTRIVQLWDIKTLRVRQTIAITGGFINQIAFSPDGHHLAVGTTMLTGTKVTNGKGFTSTKAIYAAELRLYDPATTSLQRKMVVANSSLKTLAFSPNGQTVAVGYERGADGNPAPVRLWNVQSGKLQRTLQTAKKGDWSEIEALGFSPDGKTLTAIEQTSGDFMLVWDVATGKQISKRSPAQQNVAFGLFTTSAFSPDGKSLAVSGGYINFGIVAVWNLNLRQARWSNTAPLFSMRQLAITNDGKMLGCNFNQMGFANQSISSIQIWSAKSGQLKQSMSNPISFAYSLAFSPDNTLVGAGGTIDLKKDPYFQGSLKIWRIVDDHLVRTFKPDRGASSFAFTPNSSRVVIGDGYQASLWDMKSGKDLRQYKPNFSVGDDVTVSPDGKLIASVGGRGDLGSYGELTVWNMESGKVLWTQSRSKYYIGEVAFSPSGQTIATGHSDGSTGLWNAQNGSLIRIFDGDKGGVTQVAFSKDGQSLLSSSTDGTVKIWNITTGKLQRTFDLNSPATGFALVPGGRLWTLSNNNLLQAWDLSTGRLLVTVEVLSCSRNAKGYLTTDWIAQTPDGYYDASSGAAKYIRWRVGNNLLPATAYEKKYHRPDIVQATLHTE